MHAIRMEIELALVRAGIADAVVRTVLAPAWTTDWMSEDGRRKLADYGIAPPGRSAAAGMASVACPQCGATDTSVLSQFGSTACKALWRCNACREPFDYFKCH
jgi:ring-1,2-phenylacetyl-CoA epoxidase subunit PaaD